MVQNAARLRIEYVGMLVLMLLNGCPSSDPPATSIPAGSSETAAVDHRDNVLSSADDPCYVVKRIWPYIKEADAIQPYEKFEEPAQYWLMVSEAANRHYRELLTTSPEYAEDTWQCYLDCFGRDGAQADLRWYLADVGLWLPTFSDRPSWAWLPQTRDEAPQATLKLFDALLEQELIACRLQTIELINDPEVLDRHYRFVVWSGAMFNRDPHWHFDRLIAFAERMAENWTAESDWYWWYARNFVYLVHATSRDDLLADVDPEQLHLIFATWMNWVRENRKHLYPNPERPVWNYGTIPMRPAGAKVAGLHVPEKPVPDWTGPALAPGLIAELVELNDVGWLHALEDEKQRRQD
jgi:hypothetical protein